MWRPKEGWVNPYRDKVADGCFEWQVFERGADAILRELRKTGIKATNIKDLRYPESDVLTIPTLERMKEMEEIRGCWVFIPDEEVKIGKK